MIVTIDWDFFVPENARLDMGHNETLFHINHMWHHRAHSWYMGKLEPTKLINHNHKWKSFHKRLVKHFGLTGEEHVVVSESHLEAYNVCKMLEEDGEDHIELVSFDAHTDLYIEPDEVRKQKEIQCGNWLAMAIRDFDLEPYIVLPSHANVDLRKWSGKRSMGATITKRHDFEKVIPKTKPAIIHICRSGAWTPPWADGAFWELVNLFSGGHHTEVGIEIGEREIDLEEIKKSAGEVARQSPWQSKESTDKV